MTNKNILKKRRFFIFVILFSILFISMVSAQMGCCVKTTAEAYCDDVEGIDCESGFVEGVICDDVELGECKLGACIDYSNTICMSSVVKIVCDEDGLVWDEDEEDCEDLDDWKVGCCVIDNEQVNWEVRIACTQRGDLWEFEEISFDECEAIENSADRGACIKPGGCCGCVYGTRGECTGSGGDFRLGEFCSDIVDPGVYCNEKDYGECDGNNVYWFDDCGNREEISESCIIGQQICRNDDCISLNCDDEGMKNGESNCVYDGLMNEGYAAPGSTHWKQVCDQGEIRYENCGDGRAGICQQTEMDDINKSFCVPNYAEECFEITSRFNKEMNDETGELFENGDERGLALSNTIRNKINEITDDMNKTCNENNNCMFRNIPIGTEDNPSEYDNELLGNFYDVALCLPKYPKKSDDFCEILNQNSKVFFKKRGDRYQCSGNCESLKPKFFYQLNDFCVQAGDCGLSMNYVNDDSLGDWEEGGYAYEPDSEIIYEDGFKLETRKRERCLLDVILPHEKPDGSPEDFCDAGVIIGPDSRVSHCKINIPEVFVQQEVVTLIKNKIEGNSQIKEGFIDVNWPSGYGQESLSEDYEDELVEIINQQHTQNYDGVENIEGFTERDGNKNWGWNKMRYMRIWQKRMIVWNEICDPVRKDEDKVQTLDVEFQCLPWTAPSGGDDCNECDGLDGGGGPCTKYKCESLGQACKIINDDTDKPECVSLTRETYAPIIEDISYTGADYEIEPIEGDWKNSNIITSLVGGDNCFQENNKIEFDITLDEHARCRYGYGSYADYPYAQMPPNSETNSLNQEHSFNIDVPLISSVPEEYVVAVNGEKTASTNLSIRCQDMWGNYNTEEWIINYCIKSYPDETPPQVIRFEPENEKEWEYNLGSFSLGVYLNEYAECRYNYDSNIDYSDMVNSITCTRNTDGTATCSSDENINVIRAPGINKVYIACNDNTGNINNNILYQYEIKKDVTKDEYIACCGLKITSISLEMGGTTYSSGDDLITSDESPSIDLKVSTEGGPQDGVAKCYFGYSAESRDIPFRYSESTQHKQTFSVFEEDEHTIYIKCEDEISEAEGDIEFTIIIDITGPGITYTAGEESLVVTTDEDARCTYDQSSCDFNIEEGGGMDDDYTQERTITRNPSITYYVRCADRYGNEDCEEITGTAPVDISVTGISYDEGEGNLEIRTNKQAECYYGFDDCIFDIDSELNKMETDSSGKTHSMVWNSARTHYIRCKNQWGTETAGCVAIIQPTSIS